MALGGRSKNHKRSILRAVEMSRVLDLVLLGVSYRRIAAQMDISLTKVAELVDEGRRSIPATSRDALIAEMSERNRLIVSKHMAKCHECDHALVVLKCDERFSRMLGLDAPRAVEQATAIFDVGAGENAPTPADAMRAVREFFGKVTPDNIVSVTSSDQSDDDTDA